jgi:hypothetical protein
MKTSHGLVMDGFVRGGTSSGNSQNKMHKITEGSNLLNVNAKTASTKIKSAAQGVHQRAQRSQTLMRSAVKKPADIARSVNSNVRQADIKRVKPTQQVDSSRLARVQSIDKNNKVRRFGHGTHASSAKATPQKAEVGEIVSRTPAAKTQSSTSSTELSRPLPSMVTSVSHQHLERMLDEALTNADAHKKVRYGRIPNQGLWQRIQNIPRWLSVGTVIVILVLICGFIAVTKVPQIAVRVAATKAHINAQVPGYTPSGFSFSGPVSYSDGKVSIKFKANDSSAREFTLNQTSSKMSSKSLEDKVVPDNTQVQTSVVNGNTVYIYGQSNDAAWVNNGIQYTIKDGANLNSDQLLKIASSF